MEGIKSKEGYLFQEYEQDYENCLIALKLIKKIVTKEFIVATQPPKVVGELREKWLKFFSHPGFFETCHSCQGCCCSKIYYTSLRSIELLYLVSQNSNFEFPIPDWRFIEKEIENPSVNRWRNHFPCLFLSPEGCLLGRNKSNTCLFYSDCRALLCKIGILGQKTQGIKGDGMWVEKELFSWAQRISEYFNIKNGFITNEIFGSYIIYPESFKALETLRKN